MRNTVEMLSKLLPTHLRSLSAGNIFEWLKYFQAWPIGQISITVSAKQSLATDSKFLSQSI